ncbi:unnamed protein product [Pylaiella littoralis]
MISILRAVICTCCVQESIKVGNLGKFIQFHYRALHRVSINIIPVTILRYLFVVAVSLYDIRVKGPLYLVLRGYTSLCCTPPPPLRVPPITALQPSQIPTKTSVSCSTFTLPAHILLSFCPPSHAVTTGEPRSWTNSTANMEIGNMCRSLAILGVGLVQLLHLARATDSATTLATQQQDGTTGASSTPGSRSLRAGNFGGLNGDSISVTAKAAVANILEDHNVYRCMHNAPPLVYNDTLAAEAQVWADGLSTEAQCDQPLFHSTPANGVGENLATCSWIFTDTSSCTGGVSAVVRWYEEQQFYVPGPTGSSNDPAEEIGHFTQVVWKDAIELGCAMATCEYDYDGSTPFLQDFKWQVTNVVCRYYSATVPGNLQGAYLDQVEAEDTKTEDACRTELGLEVSPVDAATPAPVVAATAAPVAATTAAPVAAATAAPVAAATAAPVATTTAAPVAAATAAPVAAATAAPVAAATAAPVAAATTAPVAAATAAPVAAPVSAMMCSDGVTPGVDGNSVVCCTTGCSQCGGSGCDSAGTGLGAGDCCGKDIKAARVYCDDTNQAPCIIGSAPPTSTPVIIDDAMCSDGTPGVDGNGGVCCTTGCTQCGGSDCGTAGIAAGLGAGDCCGKDIKAAGVYCNDTDQAPCIIGSAPGTAPPTTCSDGTPGVDGNGVVCCTTGCSECGGSSCGSAGAAAGLDASDCCGINIKASGVMCADSNQAPCII